MSKECGRLVKNNPMASFEIPLNSTNYHQNGTPGDDTFTLKAGDRSFPHLNTDPAKLGGKDTYHLETGPGYPTIENYDPKKDKIILPESAGNLELIIEEFSPYTDKESGEKLSYAWIRLYPIGTREEIKKVTSKFEGWFTKEGILFGAGALRGEGHPVANKAHLNQKLYPGEYEDFVAYNINNRKSLLSKWLEVDQVAQIEKAKTHDPIELLGSIFQNKQNSNDTNKIGKQEDFNLLAPRKFNKKSADKITNFNPSTDTLEIDTDSFGIDSSATFASGKNKKAVKKKLAKQDYDFLYDQKKGGLYFNENGTDKDFGDGGIIAILKGTPELMNNNLIFA